MLTVPLTGKAHVTHQQSTAGYGTVDSVEKNLMKSINIYNHEIIKVGKDP